MLFKFLNKQIHLDVFTYRKEVLEFFTLKPTNKLIPNWYKKIPISESYDFYPSKTLKGCYGIREILNKGFTIPLWSDLAIDIKSEEGKIQYQFADEESSIDFHNVEQWQTYADPKDNIHFKIVSPWKAKEKTGVQFLAMEFIWDKPSYNYKIVSGVTNFKQSHETHINGFFSLSQDSSFILPAEKPLIQFIPLSDKKIKYSYHLIDKKEFFDMGKQSTSYFNNSMVKIKKCPFTKYTKNERNI